MNDNERELDLLVAELESENRLLRREIDVLEAKLEMARRELQVMEGRLAIYDLPPMPAPKVDWPFPTYKPAAGEAPF